MLIIHWYGMFLPPVNFNLVATTVLCVCCRRWWPSRWWTGCWRTSASAWRSVTTHTWFALSLQLTMSDTCTKASFKSLLLEFFNRTKIPLHNTFASKMTSLLWTLLVVLSDQPPEVQPAACELCQVPGRALQLPHGGVCRHLQDTLLLHHLRRGWSR